MIDDQSSKEIICTVFQEIKRGEESMNTVVGGHGQKCMGSSEYSAKDNIKDDRSEVVFGVYDRPPSRGEDGQCLQTQMENLTRRPNPVVMGAVNRPDTGRKPDPN